MDMLFTKGFITEQYDTNYLAYILEKEELFFMTGYKVLQSQEKNGFVKCTRVFHNGKDKLVYDIAKYKTLSSILESLTSIKFLTIIANLLQIIKEVYENGFMHCDYMRMDFERVYVEIDTLKVYLIYLPIEYGQTSDINDRLTEKLKNSIQRVYMQYPSLLSSSAQVLIDVIQKPDSSVEDMQEVLNSIDIKPNQGDETPQREEEKNRDYVLNLTNEGENEHEKIERVGKEKKKSLFHKIFSDKKKKKLEEYDDKETELLGTSATGIILVGVGKAKSLQMRISKPEFMIGKKDDSNDGVILFSKAVSRLHCRIIKRDTRYYLIDENSTNGTFINGKRILPNQENRIQPGDLLRFADCEFEVKAEK